MKCKRPSVLQHAGGFSRGVWFAIALLVTGAGHWGCAPSSRSAALPSAQDESRTNVYELLADGSIHPDSDGLPRGFHVRGRIQATNKKGTYHLEPVGDVQGEGEFGTSGQPGWMELRDGSFHQAQEARAPVRPYVEGHVASDGKFRPDSRKVTY